MVIPQIKRIIKESIRTKESMIANNLADIEKATAIVTEALKQGNKILIAGNGGSAADSQHFAAELVGRFEKDRKGLSCIALTTDTSIITAWTNDCGFESLFTRQIETLGKEGDVFIGISTSGNSENILKAVNCAKGLGIKTISLLGRDGGRIKGKADLDIVVHSQSTARVQECHITILHIIAELIENRVIE